MPNPNTSDLNPDQNYDSFDVGAAASEIGSDLFPSKDKPESTEPADPALDSAPEVVKEKPAETPPADPNIVPGQNSANPNPNQSNAAPTTLPLPKSWKKEMEPVWQKMPPEAHAYVAEREAQVMRGIQMYQAGFNNWGATIKPFEQVLSNFPDVNPIQLIHGLMQTHLTFVNPNTPQEQKIQLAQLLLSEYGVNLDPNAAKPDALVMTELNRLKSELSTLRADRESRTAREREEAYNSNLSAVNTFAADPKNKYYGEVENDILRIIQSGQAKSVAEAYDIAIWTNPVVRAKVIADQQTPAKAPAAPNRSRDEKGQFVNLDSAEPRPVAPKKGSIGDTIDSIVNKHYPTHH